MKHIVLLGDSIFDNKTYVKPGEMDVPNQLRAVTDNNCTVSHLAVDGDIISDISNQLNRLPGGATHLFVSVGGNDGLGHLSVFHENINTIGEALQRMYHIGKRFKEAYSDMVDKVLSYNLPTTFCTIYYPRFRAKSLERVQEFMLPYSRGFNIQEMAMAAETVFNDVITYEVFKRGLPLIDLRVLCDDDEDFANPIEPSCIGGMKIARTISRVTNNHTYDNNISEVYV